MRGETGRKAFIHAGAALYVHVSSKAGAAGPRVGAARLPLVAMPPDSRLCQVNTVQPSELSTGRKRQEGAEAVKTIEGRGRAITTA